VFAPCPNIVSAARQTVRLTEMRKASARSKGDPIHFAAVIRATIAVEIDIAHAGASARQELGGRLTPPAHSKFRLAYHYRRGSAASQAVRTMRCSPRRWPAPAISARAAAFCSCFPRLSYSRHRGCARIFGDADEFSISVLLPARFAGSVRRCSPRAGKPQQNRAGRGEAIREERGRRGSEATVLHFIRGYGFQ
jgi:hypothetical protein